MNSYNDLFELSARPEEVITMDEAIVHNQEETVNNYIITSGLEDKFKKVFHNLTLDRGKGFWVQGAYGSGKSHFMSFLTILLHEERFWDRLPDNLNEEFKDELCNNNYLTVNFTLSEVENLRFKVFDEIEKALHKNGYQIFIKNDKDIVNQFLEGEYEGLQKDWFLNILKEKCGIKREEWEENLKLKNIRRLAEIIIEYKQATRQFSRKESREVIYPNTKEGLQQIVEKVKDNYDGVILFIDELSEFLQKKKKEDEEANTLETLQALGQRVKKAPFWIFAAVQKNPAEIINEELYTTEEEEKVFDRFEPVVLSEADIEEIIDRRLILKSESNRKSIRSIYDELKDSIPHLEENITPERFVKLYPFHHEFVRSLVYFSDYGSRQRAALRQCWMIVNERLHTPGSELITVDALYDTFRDNIIQNYFKEYYDLYENIYKEIIMKPGFDYDRELARKVIKALIIYGIRNKQHVTARELARLTMADMGLGMGLNMIYDEINDILMKIYEEAKGKGIDLEKSSDEDDIDSNLWQIQPGSTGISVEPEILEEMRNINKNDLAGQIPSIINDNQHLFSKLNVSWNTVRKMDQKFNWRNTERHGIVLIKNLNKIEKLPEISPVQNDIDFGLILGFPLEGDNDSIETCKNLASKNSRFIFWLPRKLDNETRQQMKRMTGVVRLLDKYESSENDEEYQKKIQLETIRKDLKERLDKKIENFYFQGKMVNDKRIEEDLQQFNDIKGLVETFLGSIFNDLYSKHPRYKREISRRQTNRLIRDFIIPRRNQEYTNEIENVGEPLGIVERNRDRFELNLKNELFNKINKLLADGESHDLKNIYKKIRVEPWGLQEDSFEVIIAALIAYGECRVKTRNDEIINSEKFTRNHVGGKKLHNKFVTISKGNLVNNNIWSDIKQVMDYLEVEHPDKKTMRSQDKIWSSLIDKSMEMVNNIKTCRKHLYLLGTEVGQFEKFTEKLSILKGFIDFFEKIDDFKKEESSAGLKKYRYLILDRFDKFDIFKEKYSQLKELISLTDERTDNELKKVYNYFNKLDSDLDLEKINYVKERFNELSDFINKPAEVRSFLNKVKSIKGEYIEKYVAAHRKYHNKYKNFRDKIKELEEYRTLKKLEDIEKINIHPSFSDKMENVKTNYRTPCQIQLEASDLKNKPYCSCEFRIKDNFVPLSLDKLREDFSSGIKKYFKKLKSDNYQEQINLYLEENPESKLNLLSDIEPYDIDKIIEIVDEEFILEVNRAFKVAYPVRISLQKVINLFKGTIHSSEIPEVAEKVEDLLKNRIRDEIGDKEDVEYDRAVLFFEEPGS